MQKITDAVTLLNDHGYKVAYSPSLKQIYDRITDENKAIGYTPNWDDGDELKYTIEFSHVDKSYAPSCYIYLEKLGTIYSTREIVMKIIDEINASIREGK